jgi:hypothetical protein
MKDIDPIMKQTFLKDYTDYLTIIKAMEMDQIDITIGIEQCTSLIDDIIDDIFIMDQEAHDLFIQKRNEISERNKNDKEERKSRIKDPRDSIDDRNIKRLILTQYDLPKHRKLLGIIKQIAYSQGWFR